jgi:hypothetical protein
MKKSGIFSVVLAALMLASCGGNEGAFSETEKKEQDKTDSSRHEDKFKDLENKDKQESKDNSTKADVQMQGGDQSQQSKVKVETSAEKPALSAETK